MNEPMIRMTNPAMRQTDETNKGRALFRLEEPLVVTMHVGSGHVKIVIPKGYLTDFASVPRIFWPIFPPTGPYSRAAIVHDWFYDNPTSCTRFFADSIFRELMTHLHVPAWKKVIMYYAVRVGGYFLWSTYEEDAGE